MKKFLAFVLAWTLLVLTPVATASAAGTDTEPAVLTAEPTGEVLNFAEGIEWNKKVGSPTVTATEQGAVMTGVANSWDSAGCDILPAIKSALGERDRVTVKLSLQIRATLTEGNQGGVAFVRPLLRGTNTLAGAGDADWNSAYAASLGGDAALFAMSGGNIMSHFTEGGVNLPHGEWVIYETTLDMTRNQINSSLLSEWVLCVDSIGGINMIDNIEFKALSMTETQEKNNAYLGEDPTDDSTPLPRELSGEIWSPVEILLRSTVDYENPYVETEIDATFTHSDGTTITLPGFWMAGKTWAVRFSPTKVGNWTYTVTCKDTSNTGLFAEGVIHASEATGATATAEHGFITTVKDQHYYQYADGTPFFWLGDTNWQAFTNLSTTICNYPGCSCGSQFKHIVDDRVEKGFTVYQTYFVPESGNGEKPLWLDPNHERPDTAVFNDKVDEMFAYLHEKGMVVALGLGCHTSTTNRMELEDLLRFTRYAVARYACYSVVWISGQEINMAGDSKTPGYTSYDCYMKMSALVEELDGYRHPNSAHMIPVLASDETAVRLDTSEWHDSWTVQGGHGNMSSNAGYMQSGNFYKSYYTAKESGFLKPFIESESNYEEINCGPFTGYDASRVGAWRAMLCGSAGFTYGVTGIWASSFSTSGFTGWYGGTSSYSYEPWYIGLGKPGSYEMSYMKHFFTAIGPWYDLIPQFLGCRSASFLSRPDSFLAATEDASLFVAYFFGERAKTGTIHTLDKDTVYDAFWFDPRTGRFIPVAEDILSADGQYVIPEKPDTRDWVFLLTSLGVDTHYEGTLLRDLNPTYEAVISSGEPVTPVKVQAIGGISYSGAVKESQIMTDHTSWLCDGDSTTVWTPVSNRTTQTILFDLGTAHDLSHITVNTVAGTILPRFRVEGSNDGKLWTIITDTSVREAENPGICDEPLEGVYRYVKLLLLNADSLDVKDEDRDTIPYKTMFNPMTNHSYSVTEIEDITIFSRGEATPDTEKPVVSPPASSDHEEGDEESGTVAETESDTETAPPAGTDTQGNTETQASPLDKDPNGNSGKKIALIAACAAIGICAVGAAAYAVIKRKHRA